MGTVMIEGFEHLPPAFAIDDTNLWNALLGLRNMHWDAGVICTVEAEGRIAGNALKFVRDGTPALDNTVLGFSFIPKQQMCAGFAIKFSEVPAVSIPIMSFRYYDGTDDKEQMSLWCSPDGRIFLSNADVSETISAPTIDVEAVSDASVVNLQAWTYIEVMLTLSGALPVLNVNVNGAPVLADLTSATFQKFIDQPYLSSIYFFNPATDYFNVPYSMLLDDLYLNDSAMLGPQWALRLDNGASLSGAIPVPPSYYGEAPGITPTAWDDTAVWELADLPAGVGAINAIGLTILAITSTGTLDGLEYALTNPAGSNLKALKKSTVSNGLGMTCLRSTSDTLPTDVLTDLTNLSGYLKASKVML